MRVLANEQRLEPALLESARQLTDFDPIVSRKMEGTNEHGDHHSWDVHEVAIATDRLPQLVTRSIRTAMTGYFAICIAASCGYRDRSSAWASRCSVPSLKISARPRSITQPSRSQSSL